MVSRRGPMTVTVFHIPTQAKLIVASTPKNARSFFYRIKQPQWCEQEGIQLTPLSGYQATQAVGQPRCFP